jgi:hypothetical protein
MRSREEEFMADLSKHVDSGACACTQCVLIQYGGDPADWCGWREINLCVEMRVTVFLLVKHEPVIYPSPWRTHAGEILWFTRLGRGVDDPPASERPRLTAEDLRWLRQQESDDVQP